MPEPITVQTESAAPAVVVPDTTLQDLKSGKVSMKDLDPKARSAAMSKIREEIGGAESDAAPEPAPIEKPEAEKPAEQKTPEEAPAAQPFDKASARKEHQRLSDEANAWEQKTKAAKARNEKAKADYEAIKNQEVKPPEDVWDLPHQTALNETVQRQAKQIEFLEKKVLGRDEEEAEDVARNAHDTREKELFTTIHTLQDEFPAQLKTSKPFKQLNDDNTAWLDEMAEKAGVKAAMPTASPEQLRAAAIEKYTKDPEFQKSVRPNPISEKDYAQYKLICEMNGRMAKKGGTFKANVLEWMDDEGILHDVLQKGRKEAAIDAAQRTVNAIKRTDEQPKPLSPSDGTVRDGYLEAEMTLEKAGQIQSNLIAKQRSGKPWTQADSAMLKQVNAIVRNAYAGAT